MSQEIKAYYDKLSTQYDHDRFQNSYGQFIHRQEKRTLEKFISKDGLILDLACGTGRFMEFATHGIDLSDQMIDVAKSKYPDKTFIQANSTSLPFDDNSFDFIFSFHLFMHLTHNESEQIVNECRRVLKPGGKLMFDFPSAQRRSLTKGHHNKSWHGSSAYTDKHWKNKMEGDWSFVRSIGVLYTPIHRVPKSFRKFFGWIDDWLCKSIFKGYSSYIVVVFQKQ